MFAPPRIAALAGQARGSVAAALAGLCLPFAAIGAEPVFHPYEEDEATLHLWHLDEPAPPFADSSVPATSLHGLLNGAQAASAGHAGMGAAVRFAPGEIPLAGPRPYGPILLAKPALGNDDNVDAPFAIMGANGDFTMEALVKLDVLPGDAPGEALDIIGMDDELPVNRVFLFRIEKPGFLAFLPMVGDTVMVGAMATIPTTGPHALKAGEWFHVAVTYNGHEGEDGNLKLYWTRVDAGQSGANLIGHGTLSGDLNHRLGDFAIGNSGKASGDDGPWEYFPGSIDEVRISSVERGPQDFFYVDPKARELALKSTPPPPPGPTPLGMTLQKISVGGVPVEMPPAGKPLELPSGLHRLDFDFGFREGNRSNPLSVYCRLEGLEDGWQPSARGMTMEWEMLDASAQVLARRVFSVAGYSKSWVTTPMLKRTEAIYLPENTRRIRVTVSSGPPDTTGVWAIYNMSLRASSRPDAELWEDSGLKQGERMSQIGGIPLHWERRGSDPAIARIIQAEWGRALSLMDDAPNDWGAWITTRDLATAPKPGGETFVASWSEAFKVSPGASQRATYLNVASGSYTFRAVGLEEGDKPAATELVFQVVVRQPYWKRAWFIPLVVALAVLAVGLMLFAVYRHRAGRRLAALRLQHAVERDRARIARDMHDDLGTRVTALNLAASFVRRSMDTDADKARRHLGRMETAARDLVHAMHGLVWAINSSNDTLDHLASHLSASAQEIFRDSPARLRISIPDDLPPLPLSSEFRNHLALGVKEALHNALKHAGACEVTLSLALDGDRLSLEITDTGAGFDPANPPEGNGLLNMRTRASELGGDLLVDSTPGKGTRVTFRCTLRSAPALPQP